MCMLFLSYVSELYFPYILLKRRLLLRSPLSSSAPTPSQFLIFFKRIIWWQDYIKPTGFLSVLLVNISTSLQVYTLSSSSLTGSGDKCGSSTHPCPLCYELQAWDKEVRLNPFTENSGFQTTLQNPQGLLGLFKNSPTKEAFSIK